MTPLSGFTLALRRGAALKCPRNGDDVVVVVVGGALSSGLEEVKLDRGGSELRLVLNDEDGLPALPSSS